MSYHEKKGARCSVCSQYFESGARGLSTHHQRSDYCRSVLAENDEADGDVDDYNGEEKYCEEDDMVIEEQEDRSPSASEDVEEFNDKNESEEEETEEEEEAGEEEDAYEEYEAESEEEEEDEIEAEDEVIKVAPPSKISANNESSVESIKEVHPSESPTPIDQTLLQYYEAMIDQNTDHHGSERFDANEKIQVELLVILKKMKAPLEAFETILNWAAKASAVDYRFAKPVPQRKKLLESLFQKLGMNDLLPKEKEMKFPYCGQKVNMVFHDARAVIASLLTCPRLAKDENMLFHQDDPFAKPPARIKELSDINSGRCYLESHKALIKEPYEVLLMIPMSWDRTELERTGRLSMEPINITLGIFNRKTRSLPEANRPIGYIYTQKLVDKHEQNPDTPRNKKKLTKAAQGLNDYHAQIEFILQESGFLEIQKSGFRWFLDYKGKVQEVVFRIVIPFIIGDTDGHDKYCGHHRMRGKNIKQLCRACECPTMKSDHSKAKYKLRLPKNINQLVRNFQYKQLQAMSQNWLKNGLDGVRFGMHNKRGIFGASPGEILHLIHLGEFKYIIESFFDQVGRDSIVCTQVNALTITIGNLLKRQSDRDVPRTNFPSGFVTGKGLMGHEVPGVLLVLLLTLHTTRYKDILRESIFKKHTAERGIGHHDFMQDWITLLESVLCWEQWLKMDRMTKQEVDKSRKTHRHLMRLIKFVAPRKRGMKHCRIKFHLGLHIASDVLDFGVPANVDSTSLERSHKNNMKHTGANTQRRKLMLNKQTADRLVENIAIDRCWNEIKPPATHLLPPVPEPPPGTRTDSAVGGHFYVSLNARGNPHYTWKGSKKSKSVKVNGKLLKFLADSCLPNVNGTTLHCFTEHRRDGEIFRAHPLYMDLPWNDCVMINMVDGSEDIPARILCFVDLRDIRQGFDINGYHCHDNGLYAVVEMFELDDDDFVSDLVGHFTKEVDAEGKPLLYLMDVETFIAPSIGIPDVGSAVAGDYLFLKERSAWSGLWSNLIQEYHKVKTPESDESGDEK